MSGPITQYFTTPQGSVSTRVHWPRRCEHQLQPDDRYLYDGEGRLCAVNPYLNHGPLTEYIYDAQGDRISKGTITTFSCDQTANGFVVNATYMHGMNGELLGEYDASGNPLHSNVYFEGKLLATYAASQWTYTFNDWLGTKRLVVNDGGTTGICPYVSLPYGDGNYASCPQVTENKFTGKERDSESGNDYFGARYYASTMGRFMSPDWSAKEEPVPYSSLGDPQSLNLYGYVGNNPLSKVDKDGHCWPVCTALLGAGLGALAEAGGEYLKGEKLSPYKIGAAAIAGGITGAIAGPIGDAAELGLAAKVGGQLVGNVVGGALERGLTGEKVADPKAAVADAAGAVASAGVEKGLGKQIASEIVQKVTSKAIDTAIDTARRGTPDSAKPPAPDPQQSKKQQILSCGQLGNCGK